jgi:hypothetical protein
MAKQTLFEQLSKGLADAVADIREKVVEEPWYGRVVNERESAGPEWPQAIQEQAFGSVERNIERNTPEMDMDR